MLLSVPGKVYCQIILNQMHKAVDGQLQEEQAGFRPKQSCAERIFTLRYITERWQEYQAPLVICFINFSKTFDSIHIPTPWKILALCRVLDELLTAIKKIYENLSYCVWTEDGYSSWF